jgi:hypothetical protein
VSDCEYYEKGKGYSCDGDNPATTQTLLLVGLGIEMSDGLQPLE